MAYTKEEAYVADYVFYENSILLLIGTGQKRVLRLIDKNSNTLYEQRVCGKKLSIVMDCFKNIQLKEKDSIHQVLFTDSSFSILPPYSLEDYYNTLQRCEASLGRNIVLAYTDNNQQERHYYIKKRQSKEYQLLRKIRDRESQAGFKYFATKFNGFDEAGISAASAKTVNQLNDVRELDRAYT